MSNTLSGRAILITGAARGVGRAVAEACVQQGAHVILADILSALGEQTAAQMRSNGHSVRFVPFDLGDPSSIEALADNVRHHEGNLDGLVNCGALAQGLGGVRFEDITIEAWDRVMQINVRGTWLVTRAMSPLLSDGRARIVNFASDTAMWGQTLFLHYIASKGAVISMTRSLARELGPRRIGVVGLAPGLMQNEATEDVPAARHRDYETRRAVPGPQSPVDIAEFAAFCLSDGALSLTGQVIPTNAGFHVL